MVFAIGQSGNLAQLLPDYFQTNRMNADDLPGPTEGEGICGLMVSSGSIFHPSLHDVEDVSALEWNLLSRDCVLKVASKLDLMKTETHVSTLAAGQ